MVLNRVALEHCGCVWRGGDEGEFHWELISYPDLIHKIGRSSKLVVLTSWISVPVPMGN